MKKSKLMASMIALAVSAIVFTMFPGCEDDADMGALDQYFADHPYISDPRSDPAARDVTISPTFATVTAEDQEIRFTVKGGERPFTWDTANANGTIPSADISDDTRQAIYKVVSVAENNVIVSDRRGHAAIANITRYVTTLAISPTSAECKTGILTVDFSATGGMPSYTWKNVYDALGDISGTGTSQVYTAKGTVPGTNTDYVIVIDSEGSTAEAPVVHKF